MSAEPAQKFDALEDQARGLMATFTAAGYELVAPAIIQPAGIFLNVIGESLRARTYVFTDPDGHELCLRPDLTVPTCRLHLARHPDGDVSASYCYNGPAFRYQAGGDTSAHPREFRQAGIESFAAPDREQADAAILALIAQAVHKAGVPRFGLRIGDLGLFNALLGTLEMPERWRRRLRHQFWRPEAFRAELKRLTAPQPVEARGLPAALLDKLDPDRPEAAQAAVADYLDQTGTELIGTRTLPEIAGRLRAAAADARATPLTTGQADLIERYAAVDCEVSRTCDEVNSLSRARNIDLGPALHAFQRRLDLIAAAGIDLSAARFSAEFGRNLEYYTGFVFELIAPELGPASPIAGGGRYDSLLAEVGAPHQVPAVGACIHTERLLAAIERGAR
jgi:ATP phosphoribosyltransferase regulatory subunit